MRLTTAVTLTLAGTFVVGLTLVAILLFVAAHRTVERGALREARIMMAAGIAVRNYTDKHVTPLLDRLPSDQFYPESVPSFSAQQIVAGFNTMLPDYSYRETALNPTNLDDTPQSWETDVILRFRADPALKEIVGEQTGPNGTFQYVAQPFRITNPACLTCHSVPSAAPPAMIKRYGSVNGFNWKLNDTIGARFVTVPKAERLDTAVALALRFLAVFSCILLVALVAALLVIHRTVTLPVHVLAARAEALSTGTSDAAELPERGATELRGLAMSINRLHRSVRLLMGKD